MKTRIQFDFNDEQMDLLDDLVSRMKASSRAEVVRRSLQLMNRVQNGDLSMVDVDGNTHSILVI